MGDQDPTTKPTLETLLEIVREVRDTMNRRFDAVDARLESIERKVKILNDDILAVRADLAGMDTRISKLEESRP